MKCREVNELLIAYLDDEVTPSERTLIQTHLAGCDFCRKDLAALSATQDCVSRSLQVRAAQAVPSPQAWSRLRARLAGEAPPSPSWLPAWLQRLAPGVGHINPIFHFEGGVTMKKGFALATIATLVIALSVVTFIPPVRAQVGEMLNSWFHFESPGGEYGVAIGGPAEFTPLHPTYLPAEIQSSGGGISALDTGSGSEVELAYHNDEQFLTITQSKAPADKTLPVGREVTVNGQPAVFVTGLEGTFEYGFRIPEDADVETVGTPPAERAPYHGPAMSRSRCSLTCPRKRCSRSRSRSSLRKPEKAKRRSSRPPISHQVVRTRSSRLREGISSYGKVPPNPTRRVGRLREGRACARPFSFLLLRCYSASGPAHVG